MSLQYKPKQTEEGSYQFVTDDNVMYFAFFTTCVIQDMEGNNHEVYSFGFERNEQYKLEKFKTKYDHKVKNTIVSIVKEFFTKRGSSALIYFCFGEDNLARNRSITFKRWYNETLEKEIEHHKKSISNNKIQLYGGILISKTNPLKHLLLKAIDVYFEDILTAKE